MSFFGESILKELICKFNKMGNIFVYYEYILIIDDDYWYISLPIYYSSF